MKPSAKETLDLALEMSENDRAAIAERLLAEPEQGIEEAWQHEVERRLSDFDHGLIECVPWEEVKSRLRKNSHF